MKKILAFGASSSKHSINKKLAAFVANKVSDATATVVDLNDYEMTIYSIDKEQEDGIPLKAHDFKQLILESDGIVISFAEHNGAYSAAFKNIFDWVSRINGDVWGDKPLFLLATSPGGRGGQTVLDIAYDKMGRMTKGGVSKFSLPSFNDNFSEEEGISNAELAEKFTIQLAEFENRL